MGYIVALDQGTTSSRALMFDRQGRAVASHAVPFEQLYPHPGWVEHRPDDILNSQLAALRGAIEKAGVDAGQIDAIGIANQRETTLLWERDGGRPIANAIVWQCRRSAPEVERLRGEGLEPLIRERTGLVPDAYFSGTKVKWLLDHVPGARRRAQSGELCFGTVDSYLAYHLTGGRSHVTDATNASRTMLFDIRRQRWDEELLDAMDIPSAALPAVVDSAQVVGMLDSRILGREIPLAALAGDQHAALFGQGCFEPGMTKNTYGTGCFLLMNTGDAALTSMNRLLTTVAWRIGGRVTYALEGSVFVAGAAVQWLRDEMGLIATAAESEVLARSVADNAGVYMVPAFSGLGAPYWDMYGRGLIVGLTRGTGRAHVVRAALEAIAYQTRDVLEEMVRDSGMRPSALRVDGGASANRFLMQFQADVLGVAVHRMAMLESTALGAAMLAGLAIGAWTDRELRAMRGEEILFEPGMAEAAREVLYRDWRRAVNRAMGWATPK